MADWDDDITRPEDRTASFLLRGIKTLWQLIGAERRQMQKVIVWLMVATLLNLGFAVILKFVFDELPEALRGQRLTSTLLINLGALIVLKGIMLWARYFKKEIPFVQSAIRIENHLPVAAQSKLLSLSLAYHQRENTGKKIAKITKGCDRMMDVLCNLMWGLLPHLFYLTFSLAIILVLDWKLGCIAICSFIPAILIGIRIFEKYAPEWIQYEKMKERANGYLVQSLLNVSTVQNFAQEERERTRLTALRSEMERLDTRLSVSINRRFFAMSLFMHLGFVATIIAGIFFTFKGRSTLGSVVYIIMTGHATINAMHEMVHVYARMLRNIVSIDRMKQLLDEKPDLTNSPVALRPDAYAGVFSFDEVSFAYASNASAVLSRLSLRVDPGSMVALVGKTGEGKTTVIRLLCRMYECTKGDITLDGRPIRGLDLHWYRRLFAIVQQDVEIFDASILENVRYAAPEASEEAVAEAIEAAHLAGAIANVEKFPKGIHTEVGERGVQLSGGERQRVGIARAYLSLLHGAKVLILDEATSSLDSEAESAIQNMIDRLRARQNVTIVAIAHRLSTIQKADHIYVISNGAIEEEGDHDRLMQQNGLYTRLVELQQLGEVRA